MFYVININPANYILKFIILINLNLADANDRTLKLYFTKIRIPEMDNGLIIDGGYDTKVVCK